MTNMAERLAQIWHTNMCSVQDKVTSSAFGSSMHHAMCKLCLRSDKMHYDGCAL